MDDRIPETIGSVAQTDGLPPFISVASAGHGWDATGTFRCRLGSRVAIPSTDTASGIFAGWDWDGATLTAAVDPLGFYSLFYCSDGGQIIVSPSILQLIAHGASTERDESALAVFYRLGLFLDETTPFRHIKVLPPGGRLVWSNGTTQVTGRDMPVAEQAIGRDAAIDGIIERTRSAVSRIKDSWSGDFALPLSGGRDSRHILLALDHLGKRPRECVTFQELAHGFNSETAAARRVCETLGVTHRVLASPRLASQDVLRTLTMTSLCSDEHVQMLPLHDYFGQRPFAALDGVAGDILTNPDDNAEAQFRMARAGDFTGMATAMAEGHAAVVSRDGGAGGPGALFAPDRHEEAIATIAAAMARHADAADPYQSFWFWQRTRREIGFVSSAMLASARAVFCPFLDPDVVRFCLSLPYAVTRDRQLHNDAIARGYAAARDLPYGDAFGQRPRARRNVRHKVHRIVAGVATLLALKPEHPMAELRDYLRGSRALHRRPGEVFQLYHLILARLDAEFARHLLDLSARYARAAPLALVQDSFEPGA